MVYEKNAYCFLVPSFPPRKPPAGVQYTFLCSRNLLAEVRQTFLKSRKLPADNESLSWRQEPLPL